MAEDYLREVNEAHLDVRSVATLTTTLPSGADPQRHYECLRSACIRFVNAVSWHPGKIDDLDHLLRRGFIVELRVYLRTGVKHCRLRGVGNSHFLVTDGSIDHMVPIRSCDPTSVRRNGERYDP